jgi:RimJ/RimL family protein N-acetyltransferase
MVLVKDASAEMRVVMDNRARWSQSFGCDAIRVIVDGAFRVLPLQRIEVRVTLGDEHIIETYASAGFAREGVLRATAPRRRASRDEVLMSILHDEWTGWRFEKV